ncbi:MAG: hypothetical protein CL681_08785 [Blastopirellula sp.]|mgnify:FL=1|nr:hypothetical protein [Blastopirellula sp.]
MVTALLTISLVLSADAESVDFDTQVMPILTKHGCNTAACHGAAAGRGGFKLSLFGGDVARDWHAIAHAQQARRVNYVHPERSLLLLKPTEQVLHEGGLRLEMESQEVALLQTWIRQGAARQVRRKLIALRVTPGYRQVARGESLQIKVQAEFSDGLTQEASALAVYTPSDEAAVKIDDAGRVSVHRPGQHFVVVRFLDQVRTVLLLAPLGEAAVEPTTWVRQNWIDDVVHAKLQALRLVPSPQADTRTLIRRLSLDLTGRLPDPADVELKRKGDPASALETYLDDLLASDAFVEYWTFQLAKLLRVQAQPNDATGAHAFHAWLRQQVRSNRPLDEVAQALLVAEGDTHVHGPANFYRVVAGPRQQAEYVSEVLMGVRLRCANCHNHPLDRWTQDDYHGLSAIFARLQQDRVIRVRTQGEVTHPGTGEAAQARIPGLRFLDQSEDARAALASWLLEDENPYFARAFVNRVWQSLLGRGLVEPVDDLRDTNPATHPQLLDRLARHFVDSGYDVQQLIKLIVQSATYQRSCQSTELNVADDRFYSHGLRKPLEAEVLADSICDVTGVPESYGELPPGTRAIQLVDPRVPSTALDILGRCKRDAPCTAAASQANGLAQKLHLLNGDLINAKITSQQGRLRRALREGQSYPEVIVEFYRHALSRPPTAAELRYWKRRVESAEALEDFAWALLNCEEFRTNH